MTPNIRLEEPPSVGYRFLMEYSKTKLEKFTNKSCLAVDYGKVAVGLASFTPNQTPFPVPLGRIIFQDQSQVINELKKICSDEAIDIVIVGVPYYPDGNESEMTKEIKGFIQTLREHLSLEIYEQDESYTSTAAKDRMMNSPAYNFKVDPKKIDEVAATIILEDFFR